MVDRSSEGAAPRKVSVLRAAHLLRAEMEPADLPDVTHALSMIALTLDNPDVEYLTEQGLTEPQRLSIAREVEEVARQLHATAAELRNPSPPDPDEVDHVVVLTRDPAHCPRCGAATTPAEVLPGHSICPSCGQQCALDGLYE